MKINKEEILHISNLAQLVLDEDEIEQYQEDLQDILNFANIVKNAPIENLQITIGANDSKNVFRKDEVKAYEDNKALLQNAINPEQNMFKIPRVIN